MTKLIRPLFYFCRRGVSDCNWVISRIKCIPEDRRREVSNQYEQLFMRNVGGTGRKDANEYLNGIASEYRTERPERVIKLKNKEPARAVKLKPKDRVIKSKCGLWSKDI